MQVIVLGSSGTYPTRGNPASGYLVQHEGTSVLLDAGSGTYSALCDHMDPGELDGIVLSHRHVDHCVDVFALSHRLLWGPRRESTIPMFLPPLMFEHLAAFGGEAFPDSFDVTVIEPGDRSAHAVGALHLSFAPASHSVPALLTRVESPGGTVVYSGDTGPTPELNSLARGVDLLIAEASLTEPDWQHHMTPLQAAEVAAASDCHRLALTHIRPTVDAARALAQAREVHANSVLATPGLIIPIPTEEH